jgi:hypothetical protein
LQSPKISGCHATHFLEWAVRTGWRDCRNSGQAGMIVDGIACMESESHTSTKLTIRIRETKGARSIGGIHHLTILSSATISEAYTRLGYSSYWRLRRISRERLSTAKRRWNRLVVRNDTCVLILLVFRKSPFSSVGGLWIGWKGRRAKKKAGCMEMVFRIQSEALGNPPFLPPSPA